MKPKGAARRIPTLLVLLLCWSLTSVPEARSGDVALFAGGFANANYLNSAETFDPKTGLFTPTANDMNDARVELTATTLKNRLVLVVGGFNGNPVAGADLYNSGTRSFTATGNLHIGRGGHTATLLNNGWVLIAGGFDGIKTTGSAEVYDPGRGQFALTGSMLTERSEHTATLLKDGGVLMACGFNDASNALASAELYDPKTNHFASAPSAVSMTRLTPSTPPSCSIPRPATSHPRRAT